MNRHPRFAFARLAGACCSPAPALHKQPTSSNERRTPTCTARPTVARGFTLVELLVVIAIIGMLMALLVPAIQRAREAGRRTTCLNNQHQISAAILQYVTAKDRFPSGFSLHPQPDSAGNHYCLGWVPPILPYLEQKPLYDQIMANPAWVSVIFSPLTTNVQPEISVLICPSRAVTATAAPLSYVVNAGMQDQYITNGRALDNQANGIFFDHFSIDPNWGISPVKGSARVTTDLAYINRNDGTSTTIMFSENLDAQDWIGQQSATVGPFFPYNSTPQGSTWWQGMIWYTVPGTSNWNGPVSPIGPLLNRNTGFTYTSTGLAISPPNDEDCAKPSSSHPGGFVMTMCDGHSMFVSEEIEYRVYAMCMAPNSQQVLNPLTNVGGLMTGATPGVIYPSGTVWFTPALQLRPVTEADLTK